MLILLHYFLVEDIVYLLRTDLHGETHDLAFTGPIKASDTQGVLEPQGDLA